MSQQYVQPFIEALTSINVEAEAGPNLSYSFTYKATDKEVGKFMVEQFVCPPIPEVYDAYQLGTAFRWISGSQPYN